MHAEKYVFGIIIDSSYESRQNTFDGKLMKQF